MRRQPPDLKKNCKLEGRSEILTRRVLVISEKYILHKKLNWHSKNLYQREAKYAYLTLNTAKLDYLPNRKDHQLFLSITHNEASAREVSVNAS